MFVKNDSLELKGPRNKYLTNKRKAFHAFINRYKKRIIQYPAT